MKKKLRLVAIAALVFIAGFILVLYGLGVYSRVRMQNGTAGHLSSVLSLTVWDHFGKEDWPIKEEEQLERVMASQSPASDEASVLLLDYYLGEHPSEELVINLTQRGKRVLPYLEKYRNHPAYPVRPDFWLAKLDRSTRNMMYDDVTKMIREGKVLQE